MDRTEPFQPMGSRGVQAHAQWRERGEGKREKASSRSESKGTSGRRLMCQNR